ncbi:hypothetical protein [Neptuniibacter sp.]|uniref:hypothetical protein n=1 Tax=Neptuniibacter sp. TaxID=1962643 RepID=UPI002608FAF7|nr:hypothetical protein [Neptuniibacter sp.]MCP4595327.1 hypothetical protein [Neptuniibacter sp.]
MPVSILLCLYGWPFLVGLGCYLGIASAKVRSGFLGLLKSYFCLLVAISLSWLATLFIEVWVIPHSISAECVSRLDSCNITLLEFGDWLETWNFIVLEISAVMASIVLAVKQVKNLTKTGS